MSVWHVLLIGKVVGNKRNNGYWDVPTSNYMAIFATMHTKIISLSFLTLPLTNLGAKAYNYIFLTRGNCLFLCQILLGEVDRIREP